VQVDAFAIRLRRRSQMEAADLGIRLCQRFGRSVYGCYALVVVPVAIFSLATFEIATWLPGLVLWWAKPWVDRTILFVLSRAAFGQETTVRDLWSAQRHVWWSQLIRTLTTRRLSPWRSFTQPVYQLEGQSGGRLRRRVVQIRAGHAGTAFLLTGAFSLVEVGLMISVLALAWLFAPQGMAPDLDRIFLVGTTNAFDFALELTYALVVCFLEPFYVAAGFAMYLNRRVELEAWDIEQEFRRAFAT
jgi:hypothetical protein